MSFSSIWESAISTLQVQFGEPATWYAATDKFKDEGVVCRVVFSQGMYGFGTAGWTTETRTQVTIMVSEVPTQSHGDMIVTEKSVYTLDSLVNPGADTTTKTWWVLESLIEE